MLKVLRENFRGNPNIGLYLYVTDSYCLAGLEVPDELIPKIEQVLGVPVHRASIAGTGLLGAFLAGTNKKLLVPSIIFPSEERRLQALKIDYQIIDSVHTALGNNLLCNDNGCLASIDYSEQELNTIREALGIKVALLSLGELVVIGSAGVANNKGCLIHKIATDEDIELIEKVLQVKVTRGTVNMGSGYVKSGIAANSVGMIAGDTSGGPEIVNAEEALRGEDEE